MTTPTTHELDAPPICPGCGQPDCLVYVPGDREATLANEACMALRMDLQNFARERPPEQLEQHWRWLLSMGVQFPRSPMRRVHQEVRAIETVFRFLRRAAEIETSCSHVRAGGDVKATLACEGIHTTNGRPVYTTLHVCTDCLEPTVDRVTALCDENTEYSLSYSKGPVS